jgi:hypothetical protein
MAFFSPECDRLAAASVEQPHEIDLTGQPGLAALYRTCTALMMVIGPML